MDRNYVADTHIINVVVALRKESVDRNKGCACFGCTDGHVALRKESVDRNVDSFVDTWTVLKSLSARRAWIEIRILVQSLGKVVSLSARRAWIEIPTNGHSSQKCPGRSPQGERG